MSGVTVEDASMAGSSAEPRCRSGVRVPGVKEWVADTWHVYFLKRNIWSKFWLIRVARAFHPRGSLSQPPGRLASGTRRQSTANFSQYILNFRYLKCFKYILNISETARGAFTKITSSVLPPLFQKSVAISAQNVMLNIVENNHRSFYWN